MDDCIEFVGYKDKIMYDTIKVSTTTGKVIEILAENVENWKAQAIRNNAVMRGVVGILLVVEHKKFKIRDEYVCQH